MKKAMKIATGLIIISTCWMAIKCAYGIGYRNGTLDATQETSDDLLVACEQRLDQMEDICTDAIADAVARAQEQGRQEILEQF